MQNSSKGLANGFSLFIYVNCDWLFWQLISWNRWSWLCVSCVHTRVVVCVFERVHFNRKRMKATCFPESGIARVACQLASACVGGVYVLICFHGLCYFWNKLKRILSVQRATQPPAHTYGDKSSQGNGWMSSLRYISWQQLLSPRRRALMNCLFLSETIITAKLLFQQVWTLSS